MKTNIIENNKLIAEFMGWEEADNDMYDFPDNFKDTLREEYDCIDGSLMKFNTSWDWLMPVVEKIESFIFDEDNSFNVTIGATNYCVIQDSNGEVYDEVEDMGESKIQTVYNGIVKFIKWYNKNA